MKKKKILKFRGGQDATDEYKKESGDSVRYSRSYNGETIIVAYAGGLVHGNGRPNLRFIQCVKEALVHGATPVVDCLAEDVPQATALCVKHFGVPLSCLPLLPPDTSEIWSSKAVQFTDRGYRLDGANSNCVHVNFFASKDDQGIEISTKPPVISTADEEVVSIAMFVYRIVQDGLKSLTTPTTEKKIIKKENLKKGTI